MFKLIKLVTPMGLLIGAGSLWAAGYEIGNLDLEPCVNGAVSASGTFRSDAAERRFLAEVAQMQEPCINGDVPASGVLPVAIDARPIIASLRELGAR